MVMRGDKIKKALSLLLERQDIFLAVMLLVAIFMMILPLPTELIDVLIAVNLGLSAILLMISIYIRDPLEFSVFPSLLLITTLYRLALTISTSRLVLLQHDAGEIVEAFGQFVVGGNLTVGLIIFSIITVVQFIVITKGSERVAEVSARFSLDGMPGKQMSIDGDLRSGSIDSAEAGRQRERVQKESRLFGAMDGAMKFVKGDAIASIIVILVNIIGGISVGVFQHQMSASEALQTYAVLSVGDGLASQIPSLLISITAGIVVTRVPGKERKSLANELANQVGRQPEALWMAGGILLVFALIPGFPFFVFALLASLVASPAFLFYRKKKKLGQSESMGFNAEGESENEMKPGAVPLLLHCAPNLNHSNLKTEIDSLRLRLFEHLGLPVPEVVVRINHQLEKNGLSISVYQERVLELVLAENELLIERPHPELTVRHQNLSRRMGELYWISSDQKSQAISLKIPFFEGDERIIQFLNYVFERHSSEFIGVQETRYLMDAMEKNYAELIKELQRQMPVNKISNILQKLVQENISIRDLRTIFGAIVEWAPKEKDNVMLTEYVRIALRRHICQRFSHSKNYLTVLRVGEGLENIIRRSIRQTSAGAYSELNAKKSTLILNKIKKSIENKTDILLLTSIDVRHYLRKMIEHDLFSLPVLSFQEIGDEMPIKVEGMVEFIGEELNEFE
ncbi:Secretion system apparatus protein SsaV [Candidatus Hamiltonella defensa (Bemisia tabaci)]|uniref:EscV/YscV/HrcV family type III secretion system export apparatus protein n=2 Tax=Candidatus Williamhamiltonella defendens TaxID=138072 RepID=A0A249DYW6_9ENTR|nr:EscV/YscV/HrcV family type III secretion system export apparatus protein [Candidatus Hamiltonella defensa]ASX26290.1 EscV/YscV/HrcV family type III secretion system export apparatus protein [Candidatus Hamiltonella defensa (Bemisia tabaci)]CED79453.1 Secretion system apparatus protein SsaV [Candidatus Hamiltonella defensa (Bemisia tabaci)]